MEQVGQQLILLSKWWRKKYCQKPQITTRINSLTKSSWDTLTLTAITFFPSSFILLPVVRFPHSPFLIHVSLLIVRKGWGGVGGQGDPNHLPPVSRFPAPAKFLLTSPLQPSFDCKILSSFRQIPFVSPAFCPLKKPTVRSFLYPSCPHPPEPNFIHIYLLTKKDIIVDRCWHDKYIGLLYAENFPLVVSIS